MEKKYIIVGLVVLFAIALLVFLILKNKKDRKLLNPDAPDAVEEAHEDNVLRDPE
jgi:hypothetical protein